MRNLEVGDGITWPAKMASQATALLGIRGAGKSNLARVMAEECFRSKIPVVIFDPVGNWYGIRAGRNGKPGGGLPFVIFGGRHGDVPLHADMGKELADTVVDLSLSCVLDLSHEDFSESDKRRFLAAFGDRLFRRKQGESGWMHLIFEEVDDYAPQSPRAEAAVTLGVFQRLVKRGRFKGLGVTLITQRSAAVNKDLLNMAETLVAFRTTAPRDREAVEKWVEFHDASAEAVATLHELKNGEAWVWSGLSNSLDRVRFRRMDTFDSGATPEHTTKGRAAPATLADVDVPALRERMGAAVEKAKAEDPAHLRAEIARLRAERDKARKIGQGEGWEKCQGSHTMPRLPRLPKAVEVPVLTPKELARLEAVAKALQQTVALLQARVAARMDTANEVMTRVEEVIAMASRAAPPAAIIHGDPSVPPPKGVRQWRSASVSYVTPSGAHTDHIDFSKTATIVKPSRIAGLGKGEAAVLTAVAQHSEGVTREQLSVLCGYKQSARNTYLQRLGSDGLVQREGEIIMATDKGRATLGPSFKPLPTGAALREHWMHRLTGGEREVLRQVLLAYPDAISRDDITGYKQSARNTYLQRLKSRRLITRADHIHRGGVRASDQLF